MVARAPALSGDRRHWHRGDSGSGAAAARVQSSAETGVASASERSDRTGPEAVEPSATPVGDTVLPTDNRSAHVSRTTGTRSGELVYLHTAEPEDFRAIE